MIKIPVTFIFDFDQWAELARHDPDGFERQRQETLLRVIERANNARRLAGIQCRIDLERRRARTTMGAVVRLSSMMWDSLYELKDQLNLLVRRHQNGSLSRMPGQVAKSARIIHLRSTGDRLAQSQAGAKVH